MRRRTFLAGLGFAALQLAGCSAKPQTTPDYVLTYADNQPAGYPTTQGAQYFADLVQQQTGGKVVIQVKANGEYGSEQQVWEQLAIGGVDFARVSLSAATDDLPRLNVLLLPYLYRDADHMWRVLDGSIGAEFLQDFTAQGRVGLSWYDAGARSFYARQPVRSLNDLQGKTIRVQDSQIVIDMIRLLGAVPETTAYSDVYSALETGQIDAAENNWPAYYSMEHYKVARYYMADEHSRVPEVQLASGRTWDALPEEYRQTLQACARASAQYERQLWAQEETAARKAALAGGCFELPLPEEEMQNFRQLVQPLYRKYCANYLPLVVRKQLGLYCFIEPDVPEQMSGDPMRLQQVISNLLSNAIKFTDTGCIILHVQCAGDYLQISVRDTGEGIPAKEVLRLFDPFFQVGTGVQRNFQGTGLGLAICEKLISMMDGDIAVETEPGMGSRFTIRIPLYGVQNTPQVTADGFAGKTCWLAIHNTSLAMFVTSLLSYHGLTVRRHAGETPDAEDVLLTDDEALSGWQGRAMVIFCRRHIGIPQERAAGEWLHSVTTPHELLPLLGRIFHVALASVENSRALMAPEAQVGNNDDMMILVVDDHPINRRLLADQLGSLGYQCVTANDGVDALNVLSKQHIDIVLSDVNMPNMDGYRLTQRIRQLGLTLPVIGVTANALAEEKQRCLESGMDSCLSKPVTLDVLKQTLTVYAARVRKGRE